MAADGSILISTDLDSKGAEKGMSSLTKTVESGAKAAAVAIGAVSTAIIGVAVKALNYVGELEQNMGGAEAVFKKFADTVKTKGETAFKDMGLSMSDFLATANKMGALFQGAGFSIQESADLSTTAMQRAADVASIMGIDVGAAMESIAGAAKGNFTMMDNLGVAMNATTIEAYAMAQGFEKSYKEMTNQEKIGFAMQMFLEKTAYAAGNYAKENDTLAGSLNTAKAAFENFLAGVGGVDELVDAFTNAMDVIVDNVIELVPRLIDGFSQLVTKLIPKIPPLFDKVMPTVVSGATKIIKSFIDVFVNSIPTIRDTIRKILNELAKTIGESVGILKPLTEVIAFLTADSDRFVAAIGTVVTALVGFKIITEVSGWMSALSTMFTLAAGNVTLYAAAGGTAALATEVLNGQLTWSEILIGVFNGQISLSTALTYLWNTALAANPIGLIAIAIGLCVGAFLLLNAEVRKSNEEFDAYKDSVEGMVDAFEKTSSEMDKTKEAFKQSMVSLDDESEIIQGLVDEIYELGAVSNKTAEQKERLKLRIQQLNDIAPELAVSYDEVKDSINLTKEAVEKLIKARMEEIKAEAIRERLLEIAREQLKLDKDRKTAAEATAVAQDRVTEATQRHADALKRDEESALNLTRQIVIANDERKREQEVLDTTIAAEQALTGQYQELESEYAELTKQHVEMTTARAEAVTASTDATLTAEERLLARQEEIVAKQKEIAAQKEAAELSYTSLLTEEANKWGMTLKDYEEKIEELEEAERDRIDAVAEIYGAITNTILDAFSKISDSQKEALGFEEMTKNLEHNAEVVAKWAENLDRLADVALDEGLIQKLRDAGPESAGQVNKLADELGIGVDKVGEKLEPLSTEAQKKLDKLNETLAANAEVAKEALMKSFEFDTAEMQQSLDNFIGQLESEGDTRFKDAKFTTWGKYVVSGVADGVEEEKQVAFDAMEALAEELEKMFAIYNEIQSPSKLYKRLSEHIPEGMAEGIESKSEDVKSAIRMLLEDVAQIAKDEMQRLDFTSIGRAISEGIAQGISSSAGMIADAARNAAQSAYTAAKSALQIQSPSKKGKALGENFGLSIGLGMESVEDKMETVASDFVSSIYSAANSRQKTVAQTYEDSGAPARKVVAEAPAEVNVKIENNNTWHVSKDVDVDRVMRIQQERTERQLRGKGVVLA